jgi:hypothetical protein
MTSRVFNVRLSPEDARRVSDLKRAGVTLASLVRTALRSEHERLHPKPKWRSARDLLDRIYAEFPVPQGDAPPPQAGDRRSRQKAVREHLLRKHRRIQHAMSANGRRGTKRKAT